MSIQPLTWNHARGMLPDTAASQAAHQQPVWANQLVRSRLWDATCCNGLQDHLGPTLQTGCLSMRAVKAGTMVRHRAVLQTVLTATRVSQESGSPETSIVRRQVQGQVWKSNQLSIVRHSCKCLSGRNQWWGSELKSRSWGKKGRKLPLTAPSPQLSGWWPCSCLKTWP